MRPPVFAEVWQARAFALAVLLHGKGVFNCPEWSRAPGEELARDAGAGDAGHYRAWLRALEALLAARGIAGPDSVAGMTERWHSTARTTPHGSPIRLETAPPAP